jgi:hypothetical protein
MRNLTAKKSAVRGTPYSKPVDKNVKKPAATTSDMSDSAAPAEEKKEVFVKKVLTKAVPVTEFDNVALSPAFDINVDPRFRHIDELRELNNTLDELKKEREALSKRPEGKIARKVITDKIAELEAAHRTRTKAETQAFLASKTREEILELPWTKKHHEHEKFKRGYKATRKAHSLGLSRA